MRQFQIEKANFANTQLVEVDTPVAGDGEVVLSIERFGLSANNITYAVAGDTLGYWQFFEPVGANETQMGIMPVWGFAKVETSQVDAVEPGERVFGYFPPATHVVMKPQDIAETHWLDGAERRSQLPKGYNFYRRVAAEPGYDPAHDDIRMLLYPLYVTAFVIADQIEEHEGYGAKSVVIVSASSKTSIGLAYALRGKGFEVIGLTSGSNKGFVERLGLYDRIITYDDMETGLPVQASVIVDMAGNADVLGRLHMHLGDQMKQTLSVGLTHWEAERRSSNVIKDRTDFFFAPSRIQQRMKDWGSAEFSIRSGKFVMDTAAESMKWLDLETLEGLDGLAKAYDGVLNGSADPAKGLLIHM